MNRHHDKHKLIIGGTIGTHYLTDTHGALRGHDHDNGDGDTA